MLDISNFIELCITIICGIRSIQYNRAHILYVESLIKTIQLGNSRNSNKVDTR